ncbi:QsdR family transcriptional regulator [Conexibacter stalactiti]|uniref:QsdR family transcriptional regulator n=1 Tax=Conexibacter stalactiti TaxID=1940611 RepID=A0ABU4HSY9_9ACTN|nr:QsdR family transcriptional regulator [Conexibacter stalactiti]MDW5595174.1 QsdR family transcriptional regulator [Conexibacter stalactiti]MEC5035816.1 QsdR family transcriptional regulator [Conexibacter stalactiti]
MLDGAQDPPGPEPLDAFRAARRAFLRSQRVDMTSIAEELGVSRVTLYRWVGNRAALLGEVMARLAIDTASAERQRTTGTGADALVSVATHLVQALMAFPPMQHLLRTEPDFALRVLTTAEGPTAARITEYWTREIDAEISAGRFAPALPTADLAYLIVRLSESFVYKEVIAGEPADPAHVERVFRMVLRAS